MPAPEQRPRRVALVTGGARRIGRAIVERLAADGWSVVVGCFRSALEADALARGLADAHVLAADLSTASEPGRLVRLAHGIHGRLDLVVNNAAAYRRATLAESSASLLDEAWRVNVRAPMLVMREFARLCAEDAAACASEGKADDRPEPGRIVNILDARITTVRPDQTAYWLSKRALADATRAAALEFAPGVLVNAIAPGSAMRPETRSYPPGRRAAPDPAGTAPLGRHPGPDEIAAAVAWLAGARDITGQILFLDGGMHLGGMWP